MKRLPFLIIVAFLLSACSHYYYVPNVQNVPLLKEEKELHLSAFYGGGDESQTGEVQAAYAVTDHVGIAANYIFAKGGHNSSHDFGQGGCFDGAAGYFNPVGNNGVFEVYGGLGGGSQRHEYGYYSDSYGNPNVSSVLSADLNFVKYYVQPAFGISNNLFDIAVSTRITGMSYNNIRTRNLAGTYMADDLDYLSGKAHFFAEPALTLRMGWKNIKAQFQYMYSAYLGSSHADLFENQHISFGVSVALAERYK